MALLTSSVSWPFFAHGEQVQGAPHISGSKGRPCGVFRMALMETLEGADGFIPSWGRAQALTEKGG